MPFLQDVIGQAESQIKNQVTGVQNSVKNAAGQIASNARNVIANTASNVVSNTLQSAVGAAINSANSLLQGNVSQAISSLNPANLASSALSGVLSSSSSALLSSPGYFATQSSSGGVNPGDALNGALARPDPLLSFLWYCQLPVIGSPAGTQGAAPGITNLSNSLSTFLSGITGGLGSSMGGSTAGASSQSSQLPWYYIEEATAPFRQFTITSIFRDGRERHYPSRYTVPNLRLSIYADVANTSMQYLQAWNNQILQPYDASNLNLAGGFGTPSAYKYPIYIYLLDPMKNALVILEYVECMPTNIAEYGLNSNSSERIVNHVDFSVGDMFISVLNVAPSITQALVNNAASNALNAGVSSVQNAIGAALSSF